MGEHLKNRRWIVLLNRSPKGPFTADEIRELLAQGMLRRNDLASVAEEADGKKSEWKLLWQFAEFDRRSAQEAEQITEKKLEAERRKEASAEEIRQQAIAALPPNWDEIQPEDLLHHSTSVNAVPEVPLVAETVQKSLGNGFHISPRFRAIAASLACAVGGWYFLSTTKPATGPVSRPVISAKPVERPAAAVQLPVRLPAESRPDEPPRAMEAAPTARVRSRDANVEDNIEPERGEIEVTNEDPELAEPRPKAIRRKKARAISAEDEEAAERMEGDSSQPEEGVEEFREEEGGENDDRGGDENYDDAP